MDETWWCFLRDEVPLPLQINSPVIYFISSLLSKFVSTSIPDLFQISMAKCRRLDSRRLQASAETSAHDSGSKLAVSSELCFKARKPSWEVWLPHHTAPHSAVVSLNVVTR